MNIFSAILTYIIIGWFVQLNNAVLSGTSDESASELFKFASPKLESKCDSALAHLSGHLDSAIFANADNLEVKHLKYVNLSDGTFLVFILGCGGSGEIIFIDSTEPDRVYVRKEINIPGKHAIIDGLSDLNMDKVPELRINFSAGAHGMYASFLSLYKDSVNFIKSETGSDKFFAIRGGIQVTDIDGDGIYEIKVNSTLKLGEKESYRIYKWDGSNYKLEKKTEK